MAIWADVRQSQCNMASDKDKKMDLLDSETNKLHTSYLSAEDAEKENRFHTLYFCEPYIVKSPYNPKNLALSLIVNYHRRCERHRYCVDWCGRCVLLVQFSSVTSISFDDDSCYCTVNLSINAWEGFCVFGRKLSRFRDFITYLVTFIWIVYCHLIVHVSINWY